MRSRSRNSLPSFFGRSCAVQMIPERTIMAMNINRSRLFPTEKENVPFKFSFEEERSC